MSALSDLFPADDFDEPDEPWFIEPKDKLVGSEIQRQSTFLKMMATLAPNVDIVAIPNAGKATEWERLQRWKEGARRGALDLVVTWEPTCQGDRGIAFPEFKDGKKMPDKDQRARLNRYYRMGHACGVFRTADVLIEYLRDRGCPIRPFNSSNRSA
jgi:hypothetical protein